MGLRDWFIHVCGIQLHSGAAGDSFHKDGASVKILGNPLVERTWPGSTLQLSFRGSMRLSTRLETGDPGSRLRFDCCEPQASRVGSLIFLQGLLAAVGCVLQEHFGDCRILQALLLGSQIVKLKWKNNSPALPRDSLPLWHYLGFSHQRCKALKVFGS